MRIVITGSSSGIGQVLAEHLLRQGHSVWGLARRMHTIQISGLSKMDREPEFRSTQIDVTRSATLRKAAADIARQWERIDALLHCAAAQGQIGPAATLNTSQWSDTVRVILEGTFNTISAFLPLLQRCHRRGKVVCFSGGGAAGPRPNFSAYAAAKAGVVRLVETLAAEWADLPIDINAVAPGALPTAMTAEVLAAGPSRCGREEYDAARRTSTIGLEAFGRICGLIDYLLSEDSDGIAGRLISAQWDDWSKLARYKQEIMASDVFTLRRITTADRGLDLS